MKSYTDLEQSKMLAELPLESADMWWLYITSQGKYIAMTYEEPDPHYLARMEGYGIKKAAIKCWSLAALLDVLPSGKVLLHDKGNHGYKCICNNIDTYYYNNPVDACVEMILILKEKNLL